MFENYLKIALRAMSKNKLYAAINIIGLAIGLWVFLFASILATYEQNHDQNFVNSDRIYTIGYRLKADANMGLREMATAHTALAPLIKAELSEVDAVSRSVHRSYVVSIGDKHFHERVRFAEPDFLNIFDFEFLSGNTEALSSPEAIMITEELAQKWFGRSDVQGESVLVNGDYTMRVAAVIKAPPVNTHFNSMLVGPGFDATAAFAALKTLDDYDLNGNWYNLSTGDHTYIMTKSPVQDSMAFEARLNDVFKRHSPEEDGTGFIENVKLRQLAEVNTVLWDMTGLPIVESVQFLGLLILIIAIVNYTNLASAQSLGRTREVGLRKTMGANRGQLMIQFMTESLTTAFISMLLALTLLELAVPVFNQLTGKVVSLNYLTLLPVLTLTTLMTGLLAGAYPSYLITRTTTLDALKDSNNRGQKGGLFRGLMIGTQFMLSIFMLALVMIVFFQNQKVKDSANIFPKDEVLVLERIGTDEIFQKQDLLKRKLKALQNVELVAFTSIPPFEQSNNSFGLSKTKGDETNRVVVNRMNVDHDFVSVLNIPVVAGRDFSTEVLSDQRDDPDLRVSNVLINELAARQLGFASPQEAIGESIWGDTPDEADRDNFEYRIVGVLENRNYQGLHNKVKPYIHYISPFPRQTAMVKLRANAPASTISDIESVWKQVHPDYPLEHRFLDALFNDIYVVYQAMNNTLAGFALLALTLALIGLFGLAAFMARGRTKEIGIRKVMGASVPQIVRLLLWQFSKPVLWAIAVALPLAMVASSMYLNFFAERIDLQLPLILLAGIVSVGLACGVIAVHAIRVARASPIMALRYE